MKRSTWIWIGSSLLLALILGLGTAGAQDEPAPATPHADGIPQAMPTVDRLAAPPTVPSPSQADDGAQLYWVWCQPCHGDQGQGLTDEWREQYPEDHQNCWASGCHGDNPYVEGFTLPQHVPAIIGEQSLARFQTMEELFDYVHTRMPFEYPGALSVEEALSVTAYLARAHEKWDGTRLTKENIGQFRWQPPPTATPQPAAAESRPANGEPTAPAPTQSSTVPLSSLIIAGGIAAALLIVAGGYYLWRRRP